MGYVIRWDQTTEIRKGDKTIEKFYFHAMRSTGGVIFYNRDKGKAAVMASKEIAEAMAQKLGKGQNAKYNEFKVFKTSAKADYEVKIIDRRKKAEKKKTSFIF